MSNNIKKPPLGASPYFVYSLSRITDLSDAIYRYTTSADAIEYDYDKLLWNVESWAKEIEMQCKLIRELDESEKEMKGIK